MGVCAHVCSSPCIRRFLVHVLQSWGVGPDQTNSILRRCSILVIQFARKIRRKFRINRWANKRRQHLIRIATVEDVPKLIEVEAEAWEGVIVSLFGEDELRAQIHKYPEGILLAETEVGSRKKVEAFISFIRLSKNMFSQISQENLTWEDITTSGFIDNHDPEGPYLYGVNLSVPRRAERMGIGNTIRAALGAMIVREGLQGIILESRLPKLHKTNKARVEKGQDPLDGYEYVELKDQRGKIFDPELRDYLETPLMRVLEVKPNFYQDPESENWGVLLFWPNPIYALNMGVIYKIPVLGKLFTNLTARLVRSLV